MRVAHTITVDFETFYDTTEKYSLNKMTAEEYINDPRFQVIMAAVKVDGAPAEWKAANAPDFETWFRSFPWEESAVAAHNGSFFDFLILAWVYDIYPKFYLCTLLMARPLAGERESSSLAKLAEKFGLPSKGTAIVMANGKRLGDFTPAELQEYGEYCAHDTDLCYDILLHLMGQWRPVDMAWMHVTCRMAAQPIIVLDADVLAEGLRGEEEKEGRALELLAEQMQLSQIRMPTDKKGIPLDLKKVVGSSESFADLLRQFRQEPPMKYSEKQGKYVYAFAKTDDFIRETAEEGSELPGVTEAVHARLGVKSTIMSSRLERMAGIAERMGVMPIPVRPFAAHTGRCGGTQKVNVQNYSSRKSASNPLGKANPLRRSLRVPPGYFMADGDLSQVEVRVLGGLSGEFAILDSFASDDHDPYCIFGGKLYGRPIIKGVDKRERDVSKSAVLGNGFGQGVAGFGAYCKRSGLDVTEDEAKMAVDVYRAEHPRVVAFWRECDWALEQIMAGRENLTFGYQGCLKVVKDGILLPSGRPIRYRGLAFSKRPSRYRPGEMEDAITFYDPVKYSRRVVYGSLVTENVVQGAAADIVIEAGVDLGFRHDLWARIQVHDSLVFVEPTYRLEQVCSIVPARMRQNPKWLQWVPLSMELEVGPNYGATVEVAKYLEGISLL